MLTEEELIPGTVCKADQQGISMPTQEKVNRRQDLVFGGHNMIAENGTILAEAKRFQNEIIYTESGYRNDLSVKEGRYTTFTVTGTELPRIHVSDCSTGRNLS